MKCLRSAIALALLALGSPAIAQPADLRTVTDRRDRNGVRWIYGERSDPMSDQRQIALAATWQGYRVSLLCQQGDGAVMQISGPGWTLPADEHDDAQARLDQGTPFAVPIMGAGPNAAVIVVPNEAGDTLLRGLGTARERVAVRMRQGATIVLQLPTPRPEIERFNRRCQEIAPTLPQAGAPGG